MTSTPVPATSTRPTALDVVDELSVHLIGPLPTDLDRTALAHVLAARFLAGQRSENTRRAYRVDLAAFFGWCARAGVEPLDASRSTVDAYALSLTTGTDKPASPATLARRLSTLSGFYRYAVSEAVIPRNPVEHVRRPKVSDESPTLGLDRTEARALLAAAAEHSPRARALVTLLLHDGLRISEALGADVTDLDDVRGHRVLHVTRKGGARRMVVLNGATTAALVDYLDGREDGPLFATRTGGRWVRSDAARTLTTVAAAAGIQHADRLTPHSLRHTFVTLAREAGVPLEDVQDAAGHADPRTTRRYDRARHNLDRHPAHVLGTFLAG